MAHPCVRCGLTDFIQRGDAYLEKRTATKSYRLCLPCARHVIGTMLEKDATA